MNSCSNEYKLSSPIFEKVTLDLDKKYYPGKSFVLTAAPGNPFGFYSTAKFNNRKTQPFVTHQNIQKGGKLKFLK